jgi:serine O-acetyltransferase
VIHHSTRIGTGTKCGYRGLSVLVHKKAVIGRDVMIGAHAVIGGRSGQEPPVIEDGVYIGANACVLGGISIGRNAVVGAGAVVLINVPSDATVVGNPGRLLDRKRRLEGED